MDCLPREAGRSARMTDDEIIEALRQSFSVWLDQSMEKFGDELEGKHVIQAMERAVATVFRRVVQIKNLTPGHVVSIYYNDSRAHCAFSKVVEEKTEVFEVEPNRPLVVTVRNPMGGDDDRPAIYEINSGWGVTRINHTNVVYRRYTNP